MTDTKPPKMDGSGLRVGDRVTTVVLSTQESGTESQGDKLQGRIVEDFLGSLSAEELGRTFAAQRRWAIALDDGRLVFRDTLEIGQVE
ncbi:MAG TPA: hypothetical protein VIW24_11730 [Aldersonia sp.]